MTRKRLLLCLILSLALWCGGCSEGDGDGDPARNIDVNGTYQGAWTSTVDTFRGSLTAMLFQQRGRMGGQVTFRNSPCFLTGTIDADIDGEEFNGTIRFDNDQEADVSGRLLDRGASLTGLYLIDGGSCDNDRGTFTLSR
ncbi:MAG: hypothetical protein AB7N91_26645 [Candidatus Tectimicrobiota bacterium]